MGDEQDSWFKPFGFDPGKFAADALKTVENAATAVVQEAGAVVQKAEAAISGAVKTVASAAPSFGSKPAAPAGAAGGEASSPSSLGGSVGRGGQNNPNDVKGIQRALGISDDGKCGPATIQAIENFQKSIGQAKPDGRVDPGGATSRALAGGAKGGPAAAPSSPPAEDAGDSGSFFDQAVQGVKDLGGKIVKEAEEDFDAAKALGGRVIKGAEDFGGDAKKLGGTLLDGAGGGIPGATTSDLGGAASKLPSFLKPETYGTEITLVEFKLVEKQLGKYFELEVTVGGSIKIGGAPIGENKPSKVDYEKGAVELVKSAFAEAVANAKFETGAGIKGNTTKKGKGLTLGGSVALKTNLGPVTIEFATIEVSLVNFDPKKGLTGPNIAASTSRSFGVLKRPIKGFEIEVAPTISLGAKLSPAYLSIAADVAKNLLEVTAEEAILITIDAAAVAGVPLAVAAIIGISIFSAGERGARDSAIIEGAIDTKKAAFDYAFTMTGNPAGNPGPRAKAAVAVAKAQLAKLASGRKISLEELMTELRNDKNAGKDLARFHQQARNQFFAAYHARVRNVIIDWRKDHSVQAFLTDETDDIISIGKKVDVIFAT